jgi:hypothetical protein
MGRQNRGGFGVAHPEVYVTAQELAGLAVEL